MDVVIVFLPLVAAAIAGLFWRHIGDRGAQLVTCAALLVSVVLAWVVFFDVACCTGTPRTTELFTWFLSGGFEAHWALSIDQLTAVMLIVVTIVSAMVHVYSIGYMHGDPSIPRFMSYLSLFTFCMLMLVTADNFMQLFFGWEGVGLCSYLLIGFWYRPAFGQRRGDQGLRRQPRRRFRLRARHHGRLFRLQACRVRRRSSRPRRPWPARRIEFLGMHLPTMETALHPALHRRHGQIGPDRPPHLAARRDGGPDPGLRPDPCRDHGDRGRLHGLPPLADVRIRARRRLTVVTVIGAVTAFFAATIGLVQNDIKRVIAYSTCSQLGYMFLAAGVSAYGGGHLPPVHPCLLQGAAVPGRRLASSMPCRASRTCARWAACGA